MEPKVGDWILYDNPMVGKAIFLVTEKLNVLGPRFICRLVLPLDWNIVTTEVEVELGAIQCMTILGKPQ